jgi:hypothetical protein
VQDEHESPILRFFGVKFMSDETAASQGETPPRSITSVTPEELGLTDLEAPIEAVCDFDPGSLGDAYARNAEVARTDGRTADALVYSLLQGLCQMHFRSTDRSEPFGPLIVWADGRRSIIPGDVPAALNDAIASRASGIKNAVLRAHLSDIAWTNNRRHGACASIAVEAYCDAVEQLRAGTLKQRFERADVTDHDVIGRLRRACQIAIVTEGKKTLPARLTELVTTARQDACGRKYLHGFLQAAELDLDFDISDPAIIAREAEDLFRGLGSVGDGHRELALLELCRKAFRQANDTSNEARLVVLAAECCVARADMLKMPMLESHWLARAIAIYGRGRATKERRNELRKRLIDVQERTLDDLTPIGQTIEIGDIVEKVQEKISGKSLATALRVLVLASWSPPPADLRREALNTAKEAPLSSLFATSFLDNKGKVKSQSPGLDIGENAEQETGIRFQILRSEQIRREIFVKSTLVPARAIINAEHGITLYQLIPIMQASPFVPPGYELAFAQGFARWFNGDPISGASILVPLLESSLRYLLINAGEDVTTMKNDGTQEDRSITSLFDNMREQLVSVLGEPIVFEIENLFVLRGGPGLRHAIAHGQVPSGGFYSEAAQYAPWFMFHLCCLPLLGRWNEVEMWLA